jgi:sugar phosphate isomerase/epimerase
MSEGIVYSVFTKPWRAMELERLGAFVSQLGFSGIEFPVRPGYQVEPEQVEQLPSAARRLAAYGVRIFSVAGPTDEAAVAACAEAGVPVIRVMARVEEGEGYLHAEGRLRREVDDLLPLLEKYGVKLGIQNHCDRFVANGVGLRRLIEPYDPRYVGAVWDAAHEAVSGGLPDLALDAVWSHLCMVNLKNAMWMRVNGPEAEVAHWRLYWTSGRHGLASWPRVADELRTRGYTGVVCLTAEYSDQDGVDRLIAEDLAFARSLFE